MHKSSAYLLALLGLLATPGCDDSTSTADAATDVTATDVTATDVTATDVTATDVTATDVTAADVTIDAGGACGGRTCATGEICLRQRTLGGAFLPPDDAGMCPTGRHVEGSSCVADFSYRCAARPTCTTADCACLGALCPASFMCRGADATVLTCEQLAP